MHQLGAVIYKHVFAHEKKCRMMLLTAPSKEIVVQIIVQTEMRKLMFMRPFWQIGGLLYPASRWIILCQTWQRKFLHSSYWVWRVLKLLKRWITVVLEIGNPISLMSSLFLGGTHCITVLLFFRFVVHVFFWGCRHSAFPLCWLTILIIWLEGRQKLSLFRGETEPVNLTMGS